MCTPATCGSAARRCSSSARPTSTEPLLSWPQQPPVSASRTTAANSTRSRRTSRTGTACRSIISDAVRRPRTRSSPGTSPSACGPTAWWTSASPTRSTRSMTSASCPTATSSAPARIAATSAPTATSARTAPACSSRPTSSTRGPRSRAVPGSRCVPRGTSSSASPSWPTGFASGSTRTPTGRSW